MTLAPPDYHRRWGWYTFEEPVMPDFPFVHACREARIEGCKSSFSCISKTAEAQDTVFQLVSVNTQAFIEATNLPEQGTASLIGEPLGPSLHQTQF
jgi:hypothetical protein